MSNKITKIGIILLSLILITSVLTSVYAADVTETQFADFTFKHSDDFQRTDSQSQDTHGMTFKDKNNTMYTIRDDSGAIPSSYHSSSKDIKIGNWTVNEIKLDDTGSDTVSYQYNIEVKNKNVEIFVIVQDNVNANWDATQPGNPVNYIINSITEK